MALVRDREETFSEKIADLLDKVDYRLAVTEDERAPIYRLRYDAYRREGTIEWNSDGMFRDAYDEAENCYVFGVYVHDELASSIRIHVAARPDVPLPSMGAFRDYLGPEVAAGKLVVDSTRFVVDRDMARSITGLPYATLRLCWMAVEHFQADHFLAAVRQEHQAFYRRTFQHRPVCPARTYAMLKCPISLMSVSYDAAAPWVYRRYPFFRSNFFERRMLFGMLQPAERFAADEAAPMSRVWPQERPAPHMVSMA